MTERERVLAVLATLGLVLLGGAVWGYTRMVDARDAAADAAENLAECRRLAARLGPPRAVTPSAAAGAAGAKDGTEVIRRIESSARQADFPESSIERIEPAAPERVGDGPFVEHPTVVELRGVTLRQLFTFLHAADVGPSRLGLKQIRLSAPAAADTGGRWSVEATLTQLVRAPAGTAPEAQGGTR